MKSRKAIKSKMRPAGPLPPEGNQVTTACGGRVGFKAETLRAVYDGEWIFFCLPDCWKQFEADPASSCLADRLNQSSNNTSL
jgi:YHS domain-containing protein